MRITDVRFAEASGDERVIVRCSVLLDEMLCVNGLAIVRGKGGLILAMPQHKHKDGTRRDTIHPINSETRKYMESVIFKAYEGWRG